MNGFAAGDLGGTLATWVAALATIGVWSYLVGARRIFTLLQYLLAGLATGYLVLLAIRDVLIPRLVSPLVARPGDHLLLVPAAALAGLLVAAAWLPRRATAPATAILVGGISAFALGGAVIGTILPQMAAALPATTASSPDLASEALALAITALVLLSFLHGAPRGALTELLVEHEGIGVAVASQCRIGRGPDNCLVICVWLVGHGMDSAGGFHALCHHFGHF